MADEISSIDEARHQTPHKRSQQVSENIHDRLSRSVEQQVPFEGA
jgi:hypothetical protein